MSSSDNRIIKDAKISSNPVVIAIHEFDDLDAAVVEQDDEALVGDEHDQVLDRETTSQEPALRVDEELVIAGKKQVAEMLQQANLMIDEMKQQAIREATVEAEQLKTKAAEAGKAEGHATGLLQGLDAAKQQMSAQLQQTSDQCNAMVAVAEQEARQILQEAEPKIIELVMAISRKVIVDEVETRPAAVLELVRGALAKVRDQNQIIIHVSPDDYEFIMQSRRTLQAVVGAEQTLTVTADAVLGKGGCLIETSFGTVEAGIDTQLDSIHHVLQGMLP
jgi:flagellar assembly protein FliH